MATTDWATPSSNGVPIPTAPSGISETDAASPARRSPQVRKAQVDGTRRPDLLPKVTSDQT